MAPSRRPNIRQHLAFARAYVKHFDGARAAREIGYRGEHAAQRAYEILRYSHVQEEIQRLVANASRRVEASLAETMNELAAIGFSDIRDFLEVRDGGVQLKDLDELTSSQAHSVQSVEITTTSRGDGEDRVVQQRVRLKLWDKPRALTSLLRYHGLLADFMAMQGAPVDEIDVTPEEEEPTRIADYSRLLSSQARDVDAFIDTLEGPPDDEAPPQ